MDNVPTVFIEKVCLLAFDSEFTAFLGEAEQISSHFGEVIAATGEKIHQLLVKVYLSDEKILVTGKSVAEPARHEPIFRTPLDELSLRFVTHFHVELLGSEKSDRDFGEDYYYDGHFYRHEPREAWTEVSSDRLLRLLRAIRPTGREGPHPARYDRHFRNHLKGVYIDAENYTCRKLLSLQLPFDSIHFEYTTECRREIENFLESSGPLYNIDIDYNTMEILTTRSIDFAVEKFVPLDGSCADLSGPLNRKQMEKLVLKCEMSDQKASICAGFDEYKDGMDITKLFDFDLLYSTWTITTPIEQFWTFHAQREDAQNRLHLEDLNGNGFTLYWRWNTSCFCKQ
uniref:FTH domain-containing protein n=1 Tax=Steinernema glaseri TaxID=37863 RepID=A0A1I7YQC5_9BILA